MKTLVKPDDDTNKFDQMPSTDDLDSNNNQGESLKTEQNRNKRKVSKLSIKSS